MVTAARKENEREQLQRPDGRKGAFVPKEYYEKLRLFILTFLDGHEGKTLNDIIEKAETEFSVQRNITDKSWYVLQVKLDLEARGLIKSFVPDYYGRVNHLRITRTGQKLIRQEKTLDELSNQ